ncbi:uncharacterized protein C8Q71DRAFT_741444, partial [Rhodofomes roseus]
MRDGWAILREHRAPATSFFFLHVLMFHIRLLHSTYFSWVFACCSDLSDGCLVPKETRHTSIHSLAAHYRVVPHLWPFMYACHHVCSVLVVLEAPRSPQMPYLTLYSNYPPRRALTAL